MKKRTLIFAVMTVALVMWATTVRAAGEMKLTTYGYAVDNNTRYAIGFHGTINVPCVRIDVIRGTGTIIGSIPIANPTIENDNLARLVDHGTRFFSGDIEFGDNVRSRITFFLAAYDENEERVALSPKIFYRTPQKWVFEVWSTKSNPTGCGTADVTVSYVINELYGNVIEEGRPVQFVVNDSYYDSVVVARNGKKFCDIQVPKEVFMEDFLGRAVHTVILVEHSTLMGDDFDYFLDWIRPIWMENPAGFFYILP